MKTLLTFIMLIIISTGSCSQEGGIDYRNLMLKINTDKTVLATSEKITPFYTEVKYSFHRGRRISPFIKGEMGFTYVEKMEETNEISDMSDNRYYSIGTGIDINNLSLEVAYAGYEIDYLNIREDRLVLRLKYRY